MKIAITGKIGSGKSLLSQYLEKLGAHYINLDKLGQIIQKDSVIVNKIIKNFGANYLDKTKLRNLIFNDPHSRKKLNKIMWPKIKKNMLSEFKKSKHNIIIVEGAVILQANWAKFFDKIIYIINSDSDRFNYLMKRDNIKYEQFINISNQQDSYDEYKNIITHTINNNDNIKSFYKQMDMIIKKEKWKF